MTADRLLQGCRATLAGLTFALLGATAHAATFDVVNIDLPGVGFNDTTPALPVGGNAGTTVGEQRQIVFAKVAEIWGRKLRSDVPIQVLATFDALNCTATSATLGAAGAYNIYRDFPNADRTGTWYPSALANKLTGVGLNDNPDPFESADIIAFFNGNLGNPGCLTGVSFYLGIDGAAAANQIDLLTTVLHEFGHGLGFQTFTRGDTGLQFGVSATDPAGFPSIWDHKMLDPQQRKTWDTMTPDERKVSALAPRNLVWNGKTVTRAAPRVLDRGTPELFIAGAGLAKFYMIGTASFGPLIDKKTFLAAELAQVVDQADGRGLACVALDAANAAAVSGKVAIIDRGSCAFTVKVKNAQLAGAKAVIIADNTFSTPPPNLSGTDATITIPAVRITQADGIEIKAALAVMPKPNFGAFAVLFDNPLKLAGADYMNRVYLFTPNPYQRGSSISHYDPLASPNLLMEPFATPNQAIAVSAPKDLTFELLKDLGW